ncbi:hypothetical protein BVL54_14230 [Bacillus paralicheniformis]|nr:hypothetical protein BVL54_14230 [Bacillus paralicheniformis]
MKKINTIRYLTIALLLFLLTGCWSSHEIEELGLTFAMGIDKGKETELEKNLTKWEVITRKKPDHDDLSIRERTSSRVKIDRRKH